jgi:tetratricopeptide (TPR) repeat protein
MAKIKQYRHNKYTPKALSGIIIFSELRFKTFIGVAIIVVAAVFSYLPSMSGGFLVDDEGLLIGNTLILSPHGLYRFWCTTEPLDYWPVFNTAFWLEWRLWGMNPIGYHVTNLILHIAATLLIWIILRKMSIPGAFLAALVFAVHPVNVESVAWIAQRKNLMSMLFFLLSIQCYLKTEARWSTLESGLHPAASPLVSGPLSLWFWLSLASFVLAMLSKGSVAILPVLLLAIVWWLRPVTKWDLARIAPFFLLAVALAGVNIWFQSHGAGEIIRDAGFSERLLGAGCVLWFYLYKALLPINLTFVYPQWHIQAGNWLWWLPLLAILAVTVVLWRYRKSWSRPFLFAWGFFCVALAPVLGFTDVGFMQYSLVADHYQYIAILGVITLLAAGWEKWHQQAQGVKHAAANAVAAMGVGILAYLTLQQSGLYSDPITLYQDTLNKNPDCWMVHNGLGVVLIDIGQPDKAIDHLEQSVRLKPNYFQAHNNLGVALVRTGRPREAIEHCRQALLYNPDYAEAHVNLGIALENINRTGEAIEQYRWALRLNPDCAEAYYNLGNILTDNDQRQEGIDSYRQALRLRPNFLEVHFNLGLALVQIGRPAEAVKHYREFLRFSPDSAKAYHNLALAYAAMRESTQAIDASMKALELARSDGQTALARQIEDWLDSYRAGLPNLPNSPPRLNQPRHLGTPE